jgi:hypothetical protein
MARLPPLWAPDRVSHTSRRWIRAAVGPASPGAGVANMFKKALALDYSPSEWMADVLRVTVDALRTFQDVTAQRGFIFDCDEAAGFVGPLYFLSEDAVPGVHRVELEVAGGGSGGQRSAPMKQTFAVGVKIRSERRELDPNLEWFLPPYRFEKMTKEFEEEDRHRFSASMIRLGGLDGANGASPPPGRYVGRLELAPGVSVAVHVNVHKAEPLLPPMARTLVNVCEQIPAIAQKLDAALAE